MDLKIGRQLEAGRRSESYIYLWVIYTLFLWSQQLQVKCMVKLWFCELDPMKQKTFLYGCQDDKHDQKMFVNTRQGTKNQNESRQLFLEQ